MKKILLLMFITVGCGALSAQTIEYFNSEWKKVSNKSKAAYFRKINYGSDGRPVGLVNDYYITGEPQWQGTVLYVDKNGKDVLDGWCVWFYQNGKRSQLSYYKQGRLDSTTFYWDQNGFLSREEDYRAGVLHGSWIGYYPDGKLRYYATYNNGVLVGSVYLEYDPAGKPTLVFSENFADNHNNWALQKGDKYSAEISGNKLLMRTSSPLRLGSYLYMPLPETVSFSLETVVYFEKGSDDTGHGLIWGFQDWDNYDYFLITANGYFKTGSMIKGLDVPSIPWTFNVNIRKGKSANQLKVMKEGNEYLFLANTGLLGRSKFVEMAGKNAGTMIGGGAKSIYFDRMLIKYDADPKLAGTNNAEPPSEWLGNGSGILLDRSGIVATNYHVIEGAKLIQVDFTRAGKKYSFIAEVLKTDPDRDLALLRINDKRYEAFKPATLPYGLKTTIAQTGSSIFALGYPMADVLGDEIKFTDGRVSATTGIMGDSLTYQISVPIQPGNSGGPLFDDEGNLIGITNARAKLETQNVSYAIKASYLMRLAGPSLARPKNTIRTKSMQEKVTIISEFVPMVRIK